MPRTRSQKISPEISLNNLELLTPKRTRRTLTNILANNGNKSEVNSVRNEPLALHEGSKLQNFINDKHLSDESPIAYVSLLSSDTSLDSFSSSFNKSKRHKNHSRKSKESRSIKKSLRKSLHFDVEKENESNNGTNNSEFEEGKRRSRRVTRVLEPNCFENENFEEHAFTQKSKLHRSSTFSPETPRFKHEKEADIELSCFGNENFRKNESVGILDNSNQPTTTFSSEIPKFIDNKKMSGYENKSDVNLIYSTDKKDATFSPESPHFKYQDAFDIANSVQLSEADRDVSRTSLKYKTSTPFKSDNIENSIGNTRLDSLNVERTPKSIIKQKSIRQSLDGISNRLSRSNIENSTNKTHITTRKKRSISDTEIDTSLVIPKKARVTFHPNTSVFRIDVIDSSSSNLDNSSVTMQPETSAIATRKQTPYNRRMTRILGTNPLNDQEFETSTTKITLEKDKRFYVKSATPLNNETNKSNKTPSSTKGTTPAKLNTTDTIKNKSLIKARRILQKDNSTPHPKSGGKLNKKTPKGFSSKKVPDFSSIHKKNFDKMESLYDHVHRKIERAKNLFGRPGPSVDNKDNTEILKVSKVPETSNNSTYSRFGFNIKATQNKKEQLKEQIQKKQVVNRDVASIRNQRREYVKGVRSNRRFDLLMKARANEKK